MNATARTARQTLKARSTATRAATRIHRNGAASLTTYGLSAGLTIREAHSVASSLRKAATKLHIVGEQHRSHSGRRMRTGYRYTPAQVLAMLLSYRPRKASYRAAATRLAYTLAA